MGHRKHSAPRRGSIAFRPRARFNYLVPSLSVYGKPPTEKPILLGLAGYKAGSMHILTMDDREKTPNFGKPLFNSATVVATPPLTVFGFRAYEKKDGKLAALRDVYAAETSKILSRKLKIHPESPAKTLPLIDKVMSRIVKFSALVYTSPRDAGLAQKKPYLFEIDVGGGDIKNSFAYLKSILGKEVKASDLLKPGIFVDVAAVTKGKGFEGPVTRFGVKRKQHKSRKSVRAVGVIGPWHPATVMYTVARAGQHGFHKRVEYNKRVLLVENTEKTPITPPGDYLHFGPVKGEYTVLRGSVPGPVKRLIRLRYAVRPPKGKVQPPRILGMSIPLVSDK